MSLKEAIKNGTYKNYYATNKDDEEDKKKKTLKESIQDGTYKNYFSSSQKSSVSNSTSNKSSSNTSKNWGSSLFSGALSSTKKKEDKKVSRLLTGGKTTSEKEEDAKRRWATEQSLSNAIVKSESNKLDFSLPTVHKLPVASKNNLPTLNDEDIIKKSTPIGVPYRTQSNNKKSVSDTVKEYQKQIEQARPAELEAKNIPIVTDKDPRVKLQHKKAWEYDALDYQDLADLNLVSQQKYADMVNELAKESSSKAGAFNTIVNTASGMASVPFSLDNAINTYAGIMPTGVVRDYAKFVGNDELEQKASDIYNKKVSEGSYINSMGSFAGANQGIENPIIKEIGKASNTIGNQLMSFGLGTSAGVSGSSIQALGVAGSSSQEVLDENPNNYIQAGITGILKGYASKKIEDIFDSNILTRGGEKTSIDKNITKKIADTFKSKIGRKIADQIRNVVGETAEENLENIVGYIIDKAVNNKDMPTLKEMWEESKDTTKTTVFSTVIMNVAGLGGDSFDNKLADIDTDAKFWINEAQKIIDSEGLSLELANQLQYDNNKLNMLLYGNAIANNRNMLYTNSESEGSANDQRGILGRNEQMSTWVQQKGEPQQVKIYTETEYRNWEQSIRPTAYSELTTEQKQLKNDIKRQYGKDIVFFDGNENDYNGGSSLNDSSTIYVNRNNVEQFGITKIALHETMESNIKHNIELSEDIIIPAIESIQNDKYFEKQKEIFWQKQGNNIPSDFMIAKDILCDRFSEIKSGETLDYDNVLSQETNMTIDFAIENFENSLNATQSQTASNLQQNIANNQFNSQGQQITPQETKSIQNQNMEQIDNNEQLRIDSENFSKQIDDYVSGKMKTSEFISIGKTPQILQSLGVPNNDIVLKQNKLKTIMQESSNPNDNFHGLSIETIKRIPNSLANPLNVLQSSTNPNSIVVITDLADKLERPIIASIEMNYKGQIGNVDFLSNRLTSAYGKNNYDEFMQKEIKKGNLLYDIDEGIIKELAHTKVQFLESPSSLLDTNVSYIDNSIPQNKKLVKSDTTINKYSMQNSENNSMVENILPKAEKQVAPSMENNTLATGEYTRQQEAKIENKILDIYGDITKARQKINDINNKIAKIESITDDSQYFSRASELEELENQKALAQSKIDEIENTPDTINNIVRKRTENKSIKEKAHEANEAFQKDWVNKYYTIDKLAENTKNKKLTVALDNWLGATNSSETTIDGKLKKGTGQTDINNNVIGESLTEILNPLYKDKKIIEFTDYLINLHNIARLNEKKPIYTNVTEAQSKAIANRYEQNNPSFKSIAEKLYNFLGNELNNAVEAGIGTQEQYDYFRNKYPNYVPSYRNVSDLRSFIDSGQISAKMIQKAVGGDGNVLAIDVAVSEYVMSMRKKIALNKMLVELKNSLNMQENLENYSDMMQKEDFVNANSKNMLFESEEGTFATCFENGEATTFKIPNEIYELIKPQDISKTSFAQNLIISANNMFRKAVTTYSPGFTLRNAGKDLLSGMYNTNYTAPVYFKNYLRGIKEVITNGKYYKEYTNAGLQGNTKYSKSKGMLTDASKNAFQKYNPVSLFNNAVESINTKVETLGRMGEFISSREAGNDIDIAKYETAEVTLNFKRGGEKSKAVTKYGATFFNSSVLSVEKIVKNATGKNGIKGVANFYTMVAVSGLSSIINHLLFKDDEEYEELPDYIKDGYFLIPKGNGTFYRIPKDAISVAIGSTARRVYEMASGEEDVSELGDMFATIFDNLGVSNPITNNIFAPLVQASSNKSWYGEKIVGDGLEGLNSELQYDARTNEMSKAIANQVAKLPEATKEILKNIPLINNIYDIIASPKKSDYVLQQYSGGVGDILLPMATPYAEPNYLEKELTTNSILKSKYPSEFYDALEQAESNYKSYGKDEDKVQYNYLFSVSKEMSDLYKQKREIETSNISDEEKRRRELEIQKQINQTAKNALSEIEKTKYDNNTATVNDKQYYKTNDSWSTLSEEEEAKNKNISLSTYSDYKNKIKAETEKQKASGTLTDNQQLKTKDKIQILLNSNYSNKEKSELYENYILSSKDKTYSIIKKTFTDDGLNINKYLKYTQQEFKADREEDGTVNGKTIRGSRENKVFNYIDNMKGISYSQKVILYALEYKPETETERNIVENFVKENWRGEERLEVLKKFKGVTVYKNGTYDY